MIHLVESSTAPRDTRVVYITDNQNISRWCNTGTIREKSAAMLRRIYLTCVRKNILLRVAWVSRESPLIKVPDLTLRLNTDEFGLRREDLEIVDNFFPEDFSLDAYGSLRYHHCAKYYTRYPVLGSKVCYAS